MRTLPSISFLFLLAALGTGPLWSQEVPPANLKLETMDPSVETGPDGGCDYVVQPGDTLWDIAQRMRNDAFAYRSLWSINNQEITNPHYIFPGECINFRPRADAGPPGWLLENQEYESVGRYQEGRTTEESWTPISDTWSNLSGCTVPIPFSSTEARVSVLAPGFIETTERLPLGEIVAAKEDKESLAQGDIVFMRFQNAQDVACGDIFSLYVPQGPVQHPLSKKAVLGYTYRVVGEVMVRHVQDQTVTGEITVSWDGIHRDTLVTERVPVRSTLRLREPEQDLDGYIIGKLLNESTAFFQDEVIFIDRGRRDDVKSGDRFWVVRRGDELNVETSTDLSLPDYIVGKAVVFSAGEYMSTAVLVDQDRPLDVGDRITSILPGQD